MIYDIQTDTRCIIKASNVNKAWCTEKSSHLKEHEYKEGGGVGVYLPKPE